MDSENPLGRFLRARRELVRPEDVGILPGARRRVAGLRREEVALLAGVSTDYYVRLEQGRERHPSAQVVDALARALVLEEDAVAHLHRLARPAPGRRRPAARRERVSPTLLRMMEGWPRTPAVVLGRCLTVLAHNTLGGALFDGHTHSRDLVRLVFLDPDAREFYPDWERVAANTVAGLRAAVGLDEEDPELIAVVGELSLKSETFRRLWARHDIRQKTHETKRFRHRLVGELTLDYEALTVNSAPGQQLVVYQAEPGSPSEQALSLLGSLAAEAVEAPHEPARTTKKGTST
ncbi:MULTISPECIES: helix-turn-helix domain-containing protein [Streptomyces]|uniref:Transcriptional regulator with XRE-family HTH domain n=2 Tax=Streptomyces TaxID=1883 RepID=A0ABT9KUG4_9ACTN|nr:MULTISPECIES: helix-turn-helix transcriptional regulator [Streptomyces]MDP9612084.1 transcriptional regulator with XRE-family HTH domain [Streptomyces demainii]GHJ26237.1 transcriptional regulator [Streptomyces hygroscopicus]